jgi:hypothetical protein
MIVKIQLSTSTTGTKQKMLIYDKSRKYRFEDDASEQVKELMNGRLKVFFAARMNGSKIELLEEIEDQEW